MSERQAVAIRDRIENWADGKGLELIASRLEKGHGPARLVWLSGLETSDYLAAMAMAAVGSAPYAGPPLVHGSPTRPSLEWAAAEPTLAEVFPRVPRPRRLALSAGLLQMLDFWDASHEAAQTADDLGEHTFSPYWHAIAHRREPDPGNAAYWFHRVGHHEAFGDFSESIGPILESHGDRAIAGRLLPGGVWDPIAFVSFCGDAARRPGSDADRLARRIQRTEMLVLLEAMATILA